MKVTTLKTHLIAEMNKIAVLQRKPNYVQFEMVRVIARGNTLRLEAHNEGATLVLFVGGRIEIEGECVLNSSLLVDALKSAPNERIVITATGVAATIATTDYEASLLRTESPYFNWTEEQEGTENIFFLTIRGSLLREIILMGEAYSAPASQPLLHALMLRTCDGVLEAGASDSRMGMFYSRKMDWECPDYGSDAEVLIRAYHLKAINALLVSDYSIKVSLFGDTVVFETYNVTLTLKRYMEDYPTKKVRQIKTQHINNTATVWSASLLDALVRAKASSSPKNRWVRLTMEGAFLRIATTPQTADNNFFQTLVAEGSKAGGCIEVDLTEMLPFVRHAKAERADITLQFAGYNSWADRPQNQRLLMSSSHMPEMTITVDGKDWEANNV